VYSPKIREDLIPVLYKKSKVAGVAMTTYVDLLLRPMLVADGTRDETYVCRNCRAKISIVGDDETGYCDFCESVVFVEKR
jgi:DNA-directed RNA polymerase subunit RPC12/RpoP